MKVKLKILALLTGSLILAGCYFLRPADSFDTEGLAQELKAIDPSIVDVKTYVRRISFVTDLVMDFSTSKTEVSMETLKAAINTVNKYDVRPFVDVRFTFYDPQMEAIDLTAHAVQLGLRSDTYFEKELAIDAASLYRYATE